MVKVPAKITLKGDEDCAKHFIGAGRSQLRILENQMSFQNLKQGVRRVQLNNRIRVTALACFDIREVVVDCLPVKFGKKAKRLKTELIPRFFAYIVRTDEITGTQTREYKWIYFNNKDDSVDLSTVEDQWSRLDINDTYEFLIKKTKNSRLEIMKNTPRGDHTHPHPHRHTKAFMMDGRSQEVVAAALAGGEELKPERYVSACHLLTKDRIPVFMPLHAKRSMNIYVAPDDEVCGVIDPARRPDYPLPFSGSYYLSYDDILYTGLSFPVPPRRFYCNPEDGIMVWYTTNPTITEAEDFIGGMIYNIRTRVMTTFMHYPANADGEGFEAYWAVDGLRTQMPTSLAFDVQSLTEDELTVSMLWSKRPIDCKLTFPNAVTYSETTSCTHVSWIGDDTGFEHTAFLTFEQHKLDPDPETDEEEVDNPLIDCTIYPDWDTCKADDAHQYEYQAKRTWSRYRNYDFHSLHTWDLLGNPLSIVADRIDLGVQMINYEYIRRCGCCPCFNQAYDSQKTKYIESIMEQQGAETYWGRWVCPNSLDFINNKHIKYCVGNAWMTVDKGFGSAYTPTRDDMDNRLCDWYSPYDGGSLYTVGNCFYDYDKMPGDDWIQIDTDTLIGWFITGWKWERNTNVDTLDTDTLHKYQVDEDLEFSYANVDNIYYLDDRATDNNQGLIAAGRGLSATELYNDSCLGVMEYKPDYWKVYWKIEWDGVGMEYLDITEKLLEALDCEDYELLELGLI